MSLDFYMQSIKVYNCIIQHRMKRTTFSIPDEQKKKLDAFPEINWPKVIESAIRQRLTELESFKWQA